MSNGERIGVFSYLVVYYAMIEDKKIYSEVVDAKNGKEAIEILQQKFADFYFKPTILYIQKLD